MKVFFAMFTPYQTVQMQIAALTSHLKNNDIEVAYSEYYIFTGESFEGHKQKIREKLLEEKPEIVGFSTYDMNYYHTLDCASFIKELNPKIKTLAGGHTASAVPHEYMDHDAIDFVIKGEGEHTIVELVRALREKQPLDNIEGLCWKKDNGEVVENPQRPLVENLDTLAFVDRDIVDSQQVKQDYLPVLAGRGCPYKCDYCANESYRDIFPNSNNYTRWRSPELVIEEIKQGQERYDFDYVYFYDDVFCLKLDWLKKFSELYQKNFPNLPYHCLLRPEMAQDERRIKELAASGCVELHLGVESGSYEYRRRMLGRNMTNDLILRACDMIRKYDMRIAAFLMVGMPDESCGDMIKSIRFTWKIKPETIQTGIFYPLKGTPSYDYCEKHDLIDWEKRKKLVVYSYDTSLKVSPFKRLFTIACKWIISGIPVLCHFRFALIPHFLRIQYRLWWKKSIDYT